MGHDTTLRVKADLELEYLPLPSLGTLHSRPVVSVQIEDLVEAPLACLVDSGAVYNRFPIEFANEAGINLDEPDMTDVFWAGGVKYEGAIVTVRLKIGALEWEAPVCFVPDWSQDFGLWVTRVSFAGFMFAFMLPRSGSLWRWWVSDVVDGPIDAVDLRGPVAVVSEAPMASAARRRRYQAPPRTLRPTGFSGTRRPWSIQPVCACFSVLALMNR